MLHPFMHDVTVTEEMRTRAVTMTREILGKLEGVRRELGLPPGEIRTVVEVYVGSVMDLALAEHYREGKRKRVAAIQQQLALRAANDGAAAASVAHVRATGRALWANRPPGPHIAHVGIPGVNDELAYEAELTAELAALQAELGG